MKYQWNKHGVCINPKTMSYKCNKKYCVMIELAQAPNSLWTYGVHFDGKLEGFAYSCANTLGRYSSENAAFEKAIAETIYRLQHRSEPETYKRLIEILQEELPKTQQLSLFA